MSDGGAGPAAASAVVSSFSAPIEFEETLEPREPVGFEVARGRVEMDPGRTAKVGAPLAGRVEQVAVSLGTRVQRGDRLVAVASPEFITLTHERELARLHAASSARLLRLQESLLALKAVSMKEVLLASAQLDAAHLRLKSVDSRLHGLRIEESSAHYWVTAPTSGTVVSLGVAPGQRVSPHGAGPLVTISDLNEVVTVVHVLERDAALWFEGQAVRISLPDSPGVRREGAIEHKALVVDSLTRMVPVHVRVANPDGALRLNAFVEVELAHETLIASEE